MFSAASPRRTGRLLAVAGALSTPLLPEDFLELLDPLWSQTALRARVVGVRRASARATTLTLRPGRTWTGHRAGQFVRLGVDVDGVRHWRSYSVTSPEGTETLSITVQEVPGGTVSGHLAHRTPVGTVLQLEPACGDFVLPDPLPDRLLAVTAGSGLTPVLGMLRSLDARGDLRRARGTDVVLVHSVRTPEDVVDGAELRALAATRPRLRLVEQHTATGGRLDPAALDALVPDHRDRHTYLCGPARLIDAVRALRPDDPLLHVERFTPPPRTGGRGGRVDLGGTVVEVDAATSLLEAGEAAGVLLPSGCRMGICFGCVLPLRAGRVRDLRTGVERGEPGDLVQTCVSGAAGDARIDTAT